MVRKRRDQADGWLDGKRAVGAASLNHRHNMENKVGATLMSHSFITRTATTCHFFPFFPLSLSGGRRRGLAVKRTKQEEERVRNWMEIMRKSKKMETGSGPKDTTWDEGPEMTKGQGKTRLLQR